MPQPGRRSSRGSPAWHHKLELVRFAANDLLVPRLDAAPEVVRLLHLQPCLHRLLVTSIKRTSLGGQEAARQAAAKRDAITLARADLKAAKERETSLAKRLREAERAEREAHASCRRQSEPLKLSAPITKKRQAQSRRPAPTSKRLGVPSRARHAESRDGLSASERSDLLGIGAREARRDYAIF